MSNKDPHVEETIERMKLWNWKKIIAILLFTLFMLISVSSCVGNVVDEPGTNRGGGLIDWTEKDGDDVYNRTKDKYDDLFGD